MEERPNGGRDEEFRVAHVLRKGARNVLARDPRVVFRFPQRLADLGEGQQKLAKCRERVGRLERPCRPRTLDAAQRCKLPEGLGLDRPLQVAVQLDFRKGAHERTEAGHRPELPEHAPPSSFKGRARCTGGPRLTERRFLFDGVRRARYTVVRPSRGGAVR